MGATFLPRDAAAATDLGGNAVVVPDGPDAEAAARFAAFLAGAPSMRSLCEATTVLPTRTDVTDLGDAVRPDLVPVFVAQATTIPESLVAASTSTVSSQVDQAPSPAGPASRRPWRRCRGSGRRSTRRRPWTGRAGGGCCAR